MFLSKKKVTMETARESLRKAIHEFVTVWDENNVSIRNPIPAIVSEAMEAIDDMDRFVLVDE